MAVGGPELLAALALKHFYIAARIAASAGDEQTELNAVAHAWMSGNCALVAAIGADDSNGAEAIRGMVQLMAQRAGLADLMSRLAPEELCRLANSAGHAGAMPMLEAATAAAIAQDASCAEAYRLRAIARSRSAPAAAADDARRALDLNAADAAALRAELKRLQQPKFGGPTQDRLERALHRRVSLLQTLTAAAANQGDGQGALAAVRELCELASEDPDSWTKRLHCEQLWGDRSGQVAAARAAIQCPGLPAGLMAQARAMVAAS